MSTEETQQQSVMNAIHNLKQTINSFTGQAIANAA
jgi:hypothetical protein